VEVWDPSFIAIVRNFGSPMAKVHFSVVVTFKHAIEAFPCHPAKKETCRGVPPHADPLVIGARFEDPGDKIGVKSEDHKEMTNDVREKTRPSVLQGHQ